MELAQQAVIDEHRLELAYFTTDVGQVNLRQVDPYFINLAPSVRLVEFCQWRQGYFSLRTYGILRGIGSGVQTGPEL